MKTHRGLSAVVGTVFLIAVVIGALSYISYSMDIMGNFSENLIAEETRQRNIQDESFDLLTVDIVSEKLDATIKNTGEIPVKITTLYLDEMGTNADVVQKITIDKIIAPGNSFDFFSENIDIDVDSTKGYSMKLVSSRGESQTFYLNSASQESLDIQLIALPDRVPTGFSSTIMMVVVNNMSNNNPLVNLTPIQPDCSGVCTSIDGPFPASYDLLEAGDVAIFEWVVVLEGNDGDDFEFTSGLQNGFPLNTDSKTVTVTPVQVSELAGQSIESLGFGQSELADNVLVLHLETYGIPSPEGDYQMHSGVPDNAGQSLSFTTDDSYQWFSSNATDDTTIDAGDWTVSLRYNHAALPSELDIADIGMKLHFEETDTTTDLYDSGNNSDCYSLAEAAGAVVTGAQWYSDRGVNGSGAFEFDGDDDRLSIPIDGQDDGCTNAHAIDYSVSGWFKADIDALHYDQQWIYSMINDDNGDGGGFAVYLGDGNSNNNNHGKLYFLARGDGSGDVTLCEGDEPDGDGNANYMDGEWHHFVGTGGDGSDECNLYIDGVLKDTDSGGDVGHWDIKTDLSEDFNIGADSNNANEFTGYIDDIMFWYQLEMDQTQVTALKNFPFGNNATNFNFYLNNATGAGDTLDVLAAEENVGMPWGDPYRRVNTGDEWIGNDYVVTLPQVGIKEADPFGRLNFTVERVSGEPLNLRVDDSSLIGSLVSSHLETPPVNPELPVFHTHSRSNLVTFFAFNTADSEGVWFTYQGTRIIFNGTGGHYTGIVKTVSNGVDMSSLSADTDSPFIDEDVEADIVFWHPQSTPVAAIAVDDDRIPEGQYDVSIYLNGYDEDGTVFIRTIALGNVLVVE